MNCDCLENVKRDLTEHMEKQGVVNPRLEAQFIALILEGGGRTAISLVYTVRGDNRPYNTQKGKPINMLAAYCPFCGKSTKPEAA